MQHFVPASIDSSGVVSVGDVLNEWIRGVCVGDPGAVIVFPVGGRFRCEFGLLVGSSGCELLHPGVGAYVPRGVAVVGNGSVIFQSDNGVDVGRRGLGRRLLRVVGAVGFEVSGLRFCGGWSSEFGAEVADRDGWFGLEFVGCRDVLVDRCEVSDCWSDFVRVGDGCVNVVVARSVFSRSHRNGVLLEGVAGFSFVGCVLGGVRRVAFCVVPPVGGCVVGVEVRGNRVKGLGHKFLVLAAPGGASVGGFEVVGNLLGRSALVVDVVAGRILEGGVSRFVQRESFSILDNVCDNYLSMYRGGAPMINIDGWSGVEVVGNVAWFDSAARVPFRAVNCVGVVQHGNRWRTLDG